MCVCLKRWLQAEDVSADVEFEPVQCDAGTPQHMLLSTNQTQVCSILNEAQTMANCITMLLVAGVRVVRARETD